MTSIRSNSYINQNAAGVCVMCSLLGLAALFWSPRRSSCQQSQSSAESSTPRQCRISSSRPNRRAVSSFCRHPMAAAACQHRGQIIIAGAKCKIGEGKGGKDYGDLRMKCQRCRVFTFPRKLHPPDPVITSCVQHHYLLDISPQISKCQRQSAGTVSGLVLGLGHIDSPNRKTK